MTASARMAAPEPPQVKTPYASPQGFTVSITGFLEPRWCPVSEVRYVGHGVVLMPRPAVGRRDEKTNWYLSETTRPVGIPHPGIMWRRSKTGHYNLQMSSEPIETFSNPEPSRDYEIAIRCPEFTSLCPKTGLPDFGEIRITYVPNARCIELKALKYYLIGFRDSGIFYEQLTNQILDDLVAVCSPRLMVVVGDFSARGGITTTVTARYESPGYSQDARDALTRLTAGRGQKAGGA